MNKTDGMQYFEASLRLKGMETRMAEHFIDYSDELAKIVLKVFRDMVDNFDIEREIRIQLELQYKRAIANKVECLLKSYSNEIAEKANALVRELF